MAWHVYKHNCLVSTIAQRRECAVYLQNKKKLGTISRGYPPEMVLSLMFIVGGLISWPHSIITGHTKRYGLCLALPITILCVLNRIQ
jgi:hypothetical protein